MRRKNTIEVHTSGVITPASWDDDGNVIGISIHALDEKEYLIDPNHPGETLRHFLYEKIEVTGKVVAMNDQKPVIQVASYKIIAEYCGQDVVDFDRKPHQQV